MGGGRVDGFSQNPAEAVTEWDQRGSRARREASPGPPSLRRLGKMRRSPGGRVRRNDHGMEENWKRVVAWKPSEQRVPRRRKGAARAVMCRRCPGP